MKKVSELEGAELDLWVAKARNPNLADAYKIYGEGNSAACYFVAVASRNLFAPSSRWEQAGPIIEATRMTVRSPENAIGGYFVGWEASIPRPLNDENLRSFFGCGSTSLIAAMRAYVTSVFGEEVDA